MWLCSYGGCGAIQHPLEEGAGTCSLVSAAVLLFFGGRGLFRLNAHLRALNFPALTKPTANRLNQALVRIWGIRNSSAGILLGFVWNQGDERLMAKALGAIALLPITDGFVSQSLIGAGMLKHWVFLPILGILSAGLLGWFN